MLKATGQGMKGDLDGVDGAEILPKTCCDGSSNTGSEEQECSQYSHVNLPFWIYFAPPF